MTPDSPSVSSCATPSREARDRDVGHDYVVSVHTGRRTHAGTEAKVYLELLGDRGAAREQLLGGGPFAAGSIEEFHFQAPYVGNVTGIVVRHEGDGYGDCWFLETLMVQDATLNRTWSFRPATWLSAENGNRIEVKPQGEICLGPGASARRRSSLQVTAGVFGGTPVPKIRSTRFLFEVMYFSKESVTVYVAGSTPELGEWDEDRALRMQRYSAPDGSWRGSWRLEVDMDINTATLHGPAFQYKYLIVNEFTRSVRWEPSDPRRFEISTYTHPSPPVIATPPTRSASRFPRNHTDSHTTPRRPGGVAGPNGATDVSDPVHFRDRLQTPHPTTATPATAGRWSAMLAGMGRVGRREDASAAGTPVGPSPIRMLPLASPWAGRAAANDRRGGHRPQVETGPTLSEQMKAVQAENDDLVFRVTALEKLERQFDEVQGQLSEAEASREVASERAVAFERKALTLTSKLDNLLREREQDERVWEGKEKLLRARFDDQLAVANMKASTVQEKAEALEQQLSKLRSQGILVHAQDVIMKVSSLRIDLQSEGRRIFAEHEKFRQKSKILLEASRQLAAERDAANARWQKEFAERRRLFNEVQELKGNIRVFCRVRPRSSDGEKDVCDFPDRSSASNPSRIAVGGRSFDFDRVFSPADGQDEVYRSASGIITSVLDGYRVCVFAYGQTGSGKTYTMNGPEANRGVNYRALEDLFLLSHERRAEFETTVRVSMLEIYNENLRDLQAGAEKNQRLEIKRNHNGQVYIPDLSWVEVNSVADVWNVMGLCSQNRSKGATDMNEHSSRSHLVVSVQVECVNRFTMDRSHGLLHLIDLAGSERISRSNATGERLKEAQHINKSLAALGDVFMSLLSKSSHVPFRNSKLTYLLQDALGGDSKNLMFVNISPEDSDLTETLSSLNFASRVAKVQLGVATRHNESGEVAKVQKMVREKEAEVASARTRHLELEAKLTRQGELIEARSVALKALEEAMQAMEQRSGDETSSLRRELETSRREYKKLAERLSEAKAESDKRHQRDSRSLANHKRESETLVDELRGEITRLREENVRKMRDEHLRSSKSPTRRPPLTEMAGVNVSSDSEQDQRLSGMHKGGTKTHRQVRFEEPTDANQTAPIPAPGSPPLGDTRLRPRRGTVGASRGGNAHTGAKRIAFGSRVDKSPEDSRAGAKPSRVGAARMRLPAERVAKRSTAGHTPPSMKSGIAGRRAL